MRHGKTHNHLSRKSAHRKALLKNLACALFEHKRIKTTVAKAKALKVYVEPLITKSKENTTHNRRVVFSNLQNKEAIKELFGVISEKVADRPGGYVRIIKMGFRRNDGTEMAMIELVDFNEIYKAGGDSGKASKRRSRRGSGKTAPKPAPSTTPDNDDVVQEVETSEE
jgi:large subunit ribosomal protein L17